MIEIRPACFPQDADDVRAIFCEYADSLDVDLSFQDFAAELDGLPGEYAAPKGAALLAFDNGYLAGCVAMRPLDSVRCEMKRLYVRPAARGKQLGRRLAEAICTVAREAGYSRICLDTMPSMHQAQAVYTTLGFVEVAAYVYNPVKGTRFLERQLSC